MCCCRTVITDFDKTVNSLIVKAHVLLDPNSENLYFGTKVW
jgi:hypothetical protein